VSSQLPCELWGTCTDIIPVDSYRNKVRTTMDNTGKDVQVIAPHFETRVGKRRWNDRNKRERRSVDA
jgi:hypothetical protein